MPKKANRPKFTAVPSDLVTLFQNLLKDHPEAKLRKMFGYPAAFMNGNMFAGLFQEAMFFRLLDEDRVNFLKQRDAKPFDPMPGKPMREYVMIPSPMLASVKELQFWISRALEYAKTLPAKTR